MKKKLLCLLLATSTLCLLTACGDKKQPDTTEANPGEAIVGEEIRTNNADITEVNNELLSDAQAYILMDDAFTISGKGTIITGFCYNQPFPVDTEVDIFHPNQRVETTLTYVDDNGEELDELPLGGSCGFMLDGIGKDGVGKYDLVVLKGEGVLTNKITGSFVISTFAAKEDIPSLVGSEVTMGYFSTFANVTYDGVIDTVVGANGEDINDLNPGDVAIVTITLNEEIPMVRGTEVFYQTANGIADSAACIASPVEE